MRAKMAIFFFICIAFHSFFAIPFKFCLPFNYKVKRKVGNSLCHLFELLNRMLAEKNPKIKTRFRYQCNTNTLLKVRKMLET